MAAALSPPGRPLRATALCALLALVGCTGDAGRPPAPAPLPATPLERALSGGQVHAYRLALAAGTYVEVAAEQRGIDLVLELSGPGGTSRITVDSPTGPRGEERLRAVSGTAGEHRLEVRAWATGGEGRNGGSYLLRLVASRPATATDRRRARADRVFAAAEELRRRGDPASCRQALERYGAALRAALELDDRLRQAHVHQRRAWVYRKCLEERRAAIPDFRRAIALFAAQDEVWLQASATNNLGRVYMNLGEMERAFATTRRALRLWRRAGDRREEAAALNNLALLYLTHGRMEDALAFYDRAVERLGELEDPAKETRVLHNRGQFYRSVGKPRRALDDLRRALALARTLGDRADQAAALTAIGQVHEELGEPEAAERALRQALALRRELGGDRGVARALRSLGSVEAGLGRRREARADLRRALALFRRLEARRDEAGVLVQLGSLALEDGRGADAAVHARTAGGIFAALEDPAGRASALLTLARAERAQGNLAAARRCAEAGLRLVEGLRGAPAGAALRAAYFARHQDHYDLLLDLLMELHRRDPGAGYAERALAVSERSRARSLLDVLGATGADLRRGADPALVAEEAELRRRIAALEMEASGAAAGTEAARERTLRRLLVAHDEVRGRIRRQGSGAAPGPRPLDAGEIRRRVLDPKTVLLEYDLGAERSYLWVVTGDTVSAHVLAPRRYLEALARRAHELLAAGRRREVRGQTRVVLAQLSDLLLGPVAGTLEGRRLLVVGEGALLYLPFAALPAPGGRDGAPLVAGHEVVAAPSASALAALRRRGGGEPPVAVTAAVLADPVFSPHDRRLAATGVSSAARRGEGLRRLPHSRREAEALSALLPAGEHLVALGFAAHREVVTGGALAGYRILHFATHGEVDDAHPELSRLVLSRYRADGRPRDGLLFAHQIYDLELSADLVVLSACRTALGREVRGEGLVGLTQAFFDAGAGRVLVSLWPVDDRATAELMAHFYRGLLAGGLEPAAALRAAQLHVRRQPRWSAPYYWAGFVLQGEWRRPRWTAATGAALNSPGGSGNS